MPDRGLSAYVPRELVIKSDRSLDALLPAIRSIIASADPQQPISDVQPLADVVGAETAPRRVQVRVLGAFAVIAFLLAGIGLHGLLAFSVSQGAREIGVRMALGAEQRTILIMVMRSGMQLALAGVLLGSVLALCCGTLAAGPARRSESHGSRQFWRSRCACSGHDGPRQPAARIEGRSRECAAGHPRRIRPRPCRCRDRESR
jgi:hypothetical protein